MRKSEVVPTTTSPSVTVVLSGFSLFYPAFLRVSRVSR